ncbi:MAG: tRNA (guanosine(37)-N1)-methyltransferase TrmD [Spirochaetales bacterium]|nr:MAG: tRNA (guanosine(37)-N1)-methyltransferase TrmD [Spirochaetales bacterium]
MTFHILTLFPEIVEGYVRSSLMDKAAQKGIIRCNLVNIRDFARDRHRTCDDAPYGGGAGMVLKPEPLGEALDSVGAGEKRTLYPAPGGIPFTNRMARDLSAEEELVIICGRYEGIDQRIIDLYVSDEISVGDYVLSSGEVAALIIIDAVYRLIEGVIKPESLLEESFVNGLLEYPHYTRPEEYRGIKVPDVLLSGHHRNIEKWRLQQSLEKTKKNRPDLYGNYKETGNN